MKQTRKQFFPIKKGDLLRLNQDLVYYLPKEVMGEGYIKAGSIVMFLRRLNGYMETYEYEVFYDRIVRFYHQKVDKPYHFYEKLERQSV
jgi:hypothetical protein